MYGRWKAQQPQRHGGAEQGKKGFACSQYLANHNHYPSPCFFVSVAAKGLSHAVSPLFATLARKCISVASKGVMGEANLYRSNSCGSEGGGEAASLV